MGPVSSRGGPGTTHRRRRPGGAHRRRRPRGTHRRPDEHRFGDRHDGPWAENAAATTTPPTRSGTVDAAPRGHNSVRRDSKRVVRCTSLPGRSVHELASASVRSNVTVIDGNPRGACRRGISKIVRTRTLPSEMTAEVDVRSVTTCCRFGSGWWSDGGLTTKRHQTPSMRVDGGNNLTIIDISWLRSVGAESVTRTQSDCHVPCKLPRYRHTERTVRFSYIPPIRSEDGD